MVDDALAADSAIICHATLDGRADQLTPSERPFGGVMARLGAYGPWVVTCWMAATSTVVARGRDHILRSALLKATGDERWAASAEREVIAALVAEES